VRAGVPGLLGQLPARAGVHIGEQPEQEVPGSQTWLPAAETACETGERALETLPARLLGLRLRQRPPPGCFCPQQTIVLLLIIGISPWVLLVATWWRPGVLYREWLGGSTLSRRGRLILYVRVFGVILVAALIVTPLLGDLGQ
jgi:hypothetical protein